MGSDADIVIWRLPGADKPEPFELRQEMLHSNCDYTPYEGKVCCVSFELLRNVAA